MKIKSHFIPPFFEGRIAQRIIFLNNFLKFCVLAVFFIQLFFLPKCKSEWLVSMPFNHPITQHNPLTHGDGRELTIPYHRLLTVAVAQNPKGKNNASQVLQEKLLCTLHTGYGRPRFQQCLFGLNRIGNVGIGGVHQPFMADTPKKANHRKRA